MSLAKASTPDNRVYVGAKGVTDRSRSIDSGSATVEPVTSEDTLRAMDD